MSDLIKRSDAIRTVCECECYSGEAPCEAGKGCYAVNELRKLPSADRPQGEWTCRDPYWHTAICSNCNKVTMFEEWDGKVMEYNFCPNCGARMKGADDESV